jgi:hypothetical protein
LGAVEFNLKNGYLYKEYKTIKLPDNDYLCYLEMYININYEINYDSKIFTNLENTENGNIIWAEYLWRNN